MKIMLAVDGSDQSYEAARGLSGLAPAEELTVLTVVSVPGLSYPTIGAELAKDLSMQVETAMREDAERLLERVVSLLSLNPGPVKKVLQLGDPAEIIIGTAEERHADLIVIGARGTWTHSGAFVRECFTSSDDACTVLDSCRQRFIEENSKYSCSLCESGGWGRDCSFL
ncbi:MAG: hypothetical protein GKS05_05690 [Nitrospirales bacterium]|nr:hypothetical protein [Nitrospirales bacterium]